MRCPRRPLALLSSALLLASCATSPPPSQAKAEEAAPPVVGPPEVAWEDLTKVQRRRFMMKIVLPKMRDLFRSFDPERFAEFKCATCHGEDAIERGFKMPADIYALPATPEGFQALMQDQPEWVKFMGGQVKPQMAALLGMREFDPQAPQAGGFGCYHCHPAENARER